jgi:hypothetical protein
MEDHVQLQANPFVKGNKDYDKQMMKSKAVPMHAMKAYRVEQRYISTYS